MIKLPAVYPFCLPGNKSKHQALKVLEESSELLEADKSGDDAHAMYEAMDVYQALCNYIAYKGWMSDQLEATYKEVYKSNKKKGRYE